MNHNLCIATRGMSFFDGSLPNTDAAFRVIMGGPEGKIVGELAFSSASQLTLETYGCRLQSHC